MTARGWLLLGAGAVFVVGGLVVLASKTEITVETLRRILPKAGKRYADQIFASARRNGIPVLLLAGVPWYESSFGEQLTPKGPGGTGDNGHGHGLMQIDDRTWGAWLAANDWANPAVNIEKGAQILAAELAHFGDARAALAAYNAGRTAVRRAISKQQDPDSVTYLKRYASTVLAHKDELERAV